MDASSPDRGPLPPAVEEQAGQLLVHPASLGRKPINLRLWFALYLAWLIGLTVLARWGSAHQGEGAFAFRLWLIAVGGFYLSLASTFLPVPVSPVIAAAALPQLGLADSRAGVVLLIAAAGSACTVMANLNDYHLWTFFLRFRHVARVRHSRLYRTAARWFARAAWLTLVAFTFIPIPVDVVRLLAITFRYPRWRFAAACYVGRFFRYGLLAAMVAYGGTTPRTALWLVIGVTVLTVGGGLAWAAPRLARAGRALAR